MFQQKANFIDRLTVGEQTASLNKNLRHILFQAEKSVRHVRNVKPEL